MKQHIASKAEQTANISGNVNECIQLAWDTKAPIMDWLGMEATLRAYVRSNRDKTLDEIIAAFTKRGHELAGHELA